MKPLLIPFLVALLAGIGVASGAAIMTEKAKPAPIVSDSAKKPVADSTAIRVIEPGNVAEAPATDAAPTAVPAPTSGAVKSDSVSTPTKQPLAAAPPVGSGWRSLRSRLRL